MGPLEIEAGGVVQRSPRNGHGAQPLRNGAAAIQWRVSNRPPRDRGRFDEENADAVATGRRLSNSSKCHPEVHDDGGRGGLRVSPRVGAKSGRRQEWARRPSCFCVHAAALNLININCT